MARKYLYSIVLISFIILFFINPVSSQQNVINNPAYGPDSASRIECASELSNLTEFMKINHLEYSIISWRKVYKNCPASSKNIYINGAKIFTDMLEEAKDPALQKAYFDTLMMIYDDRIKYFGEEGYVLGRKGKDMLKYFGNEYNKAFSVLKKSVELEKSESDLNVLLALMETSVAMFKDDSISSDQLLNNYLLISGALNGKPAVGSRKAIIENCSARVNELLNLANIKDCSVIETAFKKKVSEESQDTRLLNLVISLMENSGCENSDFYGELYEKVVQADNSVEKTYSLAKFYIRKERFKNAMTQLQKAVEIDQDQNNKAQYYYQMAVIANSKMNNPQLAVDYATKAIQQKSNWGEPYLLIAGAYIDGIKDCSDDPFTKSTIFWAAVDKCIKAKVVDPSIADKANNLIDDYSKFFPSKEDLFFRSIPEGSEYAVGCWINQKTTVRARK